ncbi:MAG: hypothetical protein GX295_11765 [Syntrophomonadaceae bacterium]|nr:hypothetical protein [Syntrophomonadaceae bacterium]
MKKFLLNRRGAAIPVVFLLIIPLMFAIGIGGFKIVSMITIADIDIQESVAYAVKDAAGRMHQESQADGYMRIVSDSAHESFRLSLAKNLGLNKDDLTPVTSKFAGAPRYWLMVYNGHDDYAGAASCRLYYFNGMTVTVTELINNGFPQSFAISETGIVLGEGGSYAVKLETPGVVALIEIEPKKIVAGNINKIQRWASARMVSVGGSFSII